MRIDEQASRLCTIISSCIDGVGANSIAVCDAPCIHHASACHLRLLTHPRLSVCSHTSVYLCLLTHPCLSVISYTSVYLCLLTHLCLSLFAHTPPSISVCSHTSVYLCLVTHLCLSLFAHTSLSICELISSNSRSVSPLFALRRQTSGNNCTSLLITNIRNNSIITMQPNIYIKYDVILFHANGYSMRI